MSHDQNEYNKGGMTVFILSMVVTLSFFVWVVFMSKGIDLKEVKAQDAPSAQTQAAAPTKKIDMASIKEPWISSPDLIEEGHQVFKTYCVMCHGNEGKGDGPAGMSLNPRPRNLVEGKWKKGGTTLDLFDVVTNGIPGTNMAAWKSISTGDRWALAHFIRSITQNKVPDDEAKLKKAAPGLK